ncbi:hypothetical protein NAAC61_10645 [Petrotoga sp. 8T1HF07.NaAc.6.1]|uniref:hypothetical protein n=1 Tax=Petrotoga sp. 8T1HF07.NaAc.6.1 TaxID=1351838 RepID=UPI00192CE450|nr:hypothetical protein [Petrotoga sp. 8T1HF07.NaAc.6.1]MBL5982388.1 hypothetical protein [Petrotoga sp. 8T1HF07.NaAc.6.1]
MAYERLYILVEGDDDKRFFEKILTPLFEGKYDQVKVWKYAQQKKEKVSKFLESIKALSADYIFVSDIDRTPCVTARKQYIQSKFKEIDKDRIIVVIREIESWYLAVLDDKSSKRLGIRYSKATDNVTKEQFNNLIPRKFDSKIDFMQEILKCFNIETGKHRNTSFRYFLDKHNCEV